MLVILGFAGTERKLWTKRCWL